MNQIDICYYKTRIGELVLGSFDEQLCLLDFRYRKMRSTVDARIKQGLKAEFRVQENELLADAKRQVDDYLEGRRTAFDLPLLTVGTPFQKSVWEALMKVPYGATSTYLQLAAVVGDKKAVRAVAGANGANAISLIIPCHRIIGSNGELVGYGGGLPAKKQLLKLEAESAGETGAFAASAPQMGFAF